MIVTLFSNCPYVEIDRNELKLSAEIGFTLGT
jgi:hypothetical protein